MDRYDAVLAAIPVLAICPLVVGALTRVVTGETPALVVGPFAALGPLAAVALVCHQLLIAPPVVGDS